MRKKTGTAYRGDWYSGNSQWQDQVQEAKRRNRATPSVKNAHQNPHIPLLDSDHTSVADNRGVEMAHMSHQTVEFPQRELKNPLRGDISEFSSSSQWRLRGSEGSGRL